jgi:hypothetical protein
MSRNRSDRGQAIFILPAAFLVFVLLATLVLEAAALHLRQRQLIDLADSIANDAVAFGFDIDEFRQSGDVVVNENAARSIVGDEIAISDIPTATGVLRVVDLDPPTVEVVLTMDYEYIIGGAFVDAFDEELTAVGRAELELSG